MSAPNAPQERAARLYERGHTLREIGRALGVDARTVWRWLVASGVSVRRRGPRGRLDVPDSLILELREVVGMSWQKVADAATMSKTGVRKRYARLRPRQSP